MTTCHASDALSGGEAKLPRRDWIVLPLLALLTASVLAGSTEWLAQGLYKRSAGFIPACMGPVDSEERARAIPNTVCRNKSYESEWVEYRFNRCGHRAGEECGEKMPRTYRIVMVGSSVPMGALIPREQSFAALLPQKISRVTGRSVDLYNESMVTLTPHIIASHMDEVLAANPDLILLVVVPFDIERELQDVTPQNPNRK
jgi:hypothetical protein